MGQTFLKTHQTNAATDSPSIFIEMNDCFSKRKHGAN